MYRAAGKIGTVFVHLNFIKIILTNVRNYFTVRVGRKFVIMLSLKISTHLKCIVTLPCEMTLSGANCCSVSFITPLVSGVASFNA